MQFHVDLAEPFHYSVIYLIIAGGLLVVAFIALLFVFFWRPRKKTLPAAPTPDPPLDLPALKQKYLVKLTQLSSEAGQLPSRVGYQKLSFLMRSFVFEATGIDMTKKTLTEIDSQKFPSLYRLIHEFYSPEFAAESSGDVLSAIQRVAEEIKAWK